MYFDMDRSLLDQIDDGETLEKELEGPYSLYLIAEIAERRKAGETGWPWNEDFQKAMEEADSSFNDDEDDEADEAENNFTGDHTQGQ